jgi:hypothetical protein
MQAKKSSNFAERGRAMNTETQLVKSFVVADDLGGLHNVSMYVETPHAPGVPPRPMPRFQLKGGLVLESLDHQEEQFRIVGTGVLLRRIGPFAP